MPLRLTLEELAEMAGEQVALLEDWRERGLFPSDEGEYTYEDLERVRMTQTCLRRGLTVDDVLSVVGTFSLENSSSRRPGMQVDLAGTLSEVVDRLGMDPEQADRLWNAAGLTDQGEAVSKADAAMLRGSKAVLDVGFPEGAILEIYRVLVQMLGRAAEAMTHTTHVYQLEAPVIQGEEIGNVTDRARAMSPTIGAFTEPMVLYFARKAIMRAFREDFAVHVAIETGKAAYSDVPGRVHRTIAFIDLSDFTPLTATRSDVEGAEVLSQFRELVHAAVTRASGSVVKQIGDEFMLAFHNAGDAVECVLAIHTEVDAKRQFPAVRTGLHSGEMLYRDGDYVGTVPNAAARIRGVAGRHQIMVSGDARREAGNVDGAEFVRVGRRALKGLPEDMEVFEVVPGVSAGDARTVDPVCGIEMTAGSVAAQLTLDGVVREFCSDDCLRKFVSEPGRYAAKEAS